MSYEKHTWETGETITAEKLNNLEDELNYLNEKNNAFIIGVSANNGKTLVLNKTWAEINDAFCSGKNCIIINENNGTSVSNLIISVVNNDNFYIIVFNAGENMVSLFTDSPNKYPEYTTESTQTPVS